MTTCDNGGSAFHESPLGSVDEPARPARRRNKGELTDELKTKLHARALREKPPRPYRLGLRSQECAHRGCSFIRTQMNDPHSLCVLHAWKKRYGIED